MLNVAKLATLHASLLLTSFSLSDCSSTRDAFVNAHTHIQEYLDHGQSEGGVRPSLSLIGLDHDISLTGVSFEFLSRGYFFFFSRMAGRTSAPWDFC